MSNRKFTLDAVNQMSWEGFGLIVGNLVKNIENYCEINQMKFDAIAPILRNGAIPGTIIANKLWITTLLPIQVKYDYELKMPIQLLPFVKPLKNNLGESPKILVTESNTFSGESARLTAQIIKQKYPDVELYYATVTQVYRQKEIDLSMYQKVFYGVMTNENFEANEETEKKLQLRPKITIYPWETAEEELKDINSYFE